MKKYIHVFIADLPKRFWSIIEDVAVTSIEESSDSIDGGCIVFFISIKNDSVKELKQLPGQTSIIKEEKREITKANTLLRFMKQNNIDFIDL